MARVNVLVSDELLRAIDAEATASGTNRSALIQSALTAYLDARRREREEAALRKDMEAACRGMDSLAENLGRWNPTPVIREFRGGRLLGD